MKKKIWMMLLCGALVCFPLGGCGINRADADTGSVQSEAASDHKTTKNSNAEYTSEVFAMDTYMTLTAYGENAKEAVEAGIAEIQRLDALLSTGDANSEVAQINQNGGGTLFEDTDYLVKAMTAYFSRDFHRDRDGGIVF